MVNLNHAVNTLKACYISPNIINLDLAKDKFAAKAAMAQLQTAIESGQVSASDVNKMITEVGELQ